VNIYIETNFVLELVFEQEQHTSCEQILALGESGRLRLIIPAYCLAEPHEKLTRQAGSRRELQRSLETELRQLARTASYTARINIGCLNRPSAVDRFLDSSRQSRFSHIRWPNIFNHTRGRLGHQMRPILIPTTC